MTIGATINYSVPAVGTTVDTLDKFREALFSNSLTVGTSTVPIVFQLRAASIAGLQKRFGATWKYNPAVLDTASTTTNGRVAISVNVDATLGTEITESALANHVRYALSALLASTLIEGLRDGNLT